MKENKYVILIIFNIIIGGHCFHSDLMHQMCGLAITRSYGEVIFDASELPDDVRSCGITVVSKSHRNHPNATSHLMFYFTEFQMPDHCNSGLLSVYDVANTSKSSEKGMARDMCGYNQTVVTTDTVFTSFDDRFIVSFIRTDAKKRNSGSFILKYSRFHTGVCEISKEVQCSQGNIDHMCVRKDVICDSKVNVCQQNFNDSICSPKPPQENSTVFLKYILCVLLGIFMLIGIKFFYRQYRKGRERDEDCFSSIKQNIVGKQKDCSNAHVSSLENYAALGESSIHARDDVEREVNSTDTTSADIHLGIATSPSAPTLEEIELDIPDSLPPTYDESAIPSYNEVMAHQDRYIVH